MSDRQYRRKRKTDMTEKSSFRSLPQGNAVRDAQAIKQAIDENLHTVHFNTQDVRSVMSAVRNGRKRVAAKKKRSVLRPDLVSAFALVLLVALPISLYGFHSKESITTIAASSNQPTTRPAISFDPVIEPITAVPTVLPTFPPQAETPLAPSADGSISESEAVRIARECFNTYCDTSIFTFDEYEVSVTYHDGEMPQYSVLMESIYNNGCSFSVILNAENGEVFQYSTPRMATVPSYVDSSRPEIRAWFDKYGEHLFTWPQDAQAEFSRRYQGGMLRTAKESEISYETALTAVSQPITSKAPDLFTAFYPVLYSERASSSGRAFYTVYCYASASDDILTESTPMTVSFDAETGDIISIEGNPLDHSLGIESISSIK